MRTIVVAHGDGIGPEIMHSTLKILQAAKAELRFETIEIGEKLYKKGYTSGISPEAWNLVKKHKILLKAPITTPQGSGYKSLNVTFRKALGLYANIRPCVSYRPFVKSNYDMDMVIVRENEEDLYAGIEYQPTSNQALSLKFISERGSEKIIRYAFAYARKLGRKKVTTLVKDNIMKISDGLFHVKFKEIAAEYPDIEAESMIVDIGAARIAARPEHFDVVVTLNLYGDIVSDIAAEVSGSVGLAGSSNIGDEYAMFEAIHGSAPDIAGQGIANPSGLLNGAVMGLEYIGQFDTAAKIKNAWLRTIEDGIHTADLYNSESKQKVSTEEFTEAVIENIGNKPKKLSSIKAAENIESNKQTSALKEQSFPQKKKKLIGADLYIPSELDEVVSKLENAHNAFKLHTVSAMGISVWPNGNVDDITSDLLQCRLIGYEDTGMTQELILELMQKANEAGLEISFMHSLYLYDGQIGFSQAQGE